MHAASLSPAYTIEEVVNNFQVLLEHMDFEQELTLAGVGQARFLLRRKLKNEWQILMIALWRLALERSFPHDGQIIFDTFLERHTAGLGANRAKNFMERVKTYVESLQSHGDTDFMPTGERLLSLIKPAASAAPALQLRVALHIRSLYTLIFDRLI
ncbi:MAG: hypothetical protein LBC10_01670 [Deltaproteobacteria bacterium]|jgi:hypothetical protein|nr:hypothetical protein [Deltaproteobacteria bacterium]